jgi:hypothetical protein
MSLVKPIHESVLVNLGTLQESWFISALQLEAICMFFLRFVWLVVLWTNHLAEMVWTLRSMVGCFYQLADIRGYEQMPQAFLSGMVLSAGRHSKL